MRNRCLLVLPVVLLPVLLAACQSLPATVATPTPTATRATPVAAIELREPRSGLYTAGQPAAGEWQAIAARGVATVVNLRTPEEMGGRDEASEVRSAGMRYVSIPVGGVGGITDANARLLRQTLAEAGGNALVHCSSGNRAGGLLALIEARNGTMSEAQALAFGRAAGMASSEARVKALLEAPAVACVPGTTPTTSAAAPASGAAAVIEHCP